MKILVILLTLIFLIGCTTCYRNAELRNFQYDEILCSGYAVNQGNTIAPNYQTNYSGHYSGGNISGSANTYDANAPMRLFMQGYSKSKCLEALGWYEVPCK